MPWFLRLWFCVVSLLGYVGFISNKIAYNRSFVNMVLDFSGNFQFIIFLSMFFSQFRTDLIAALAMTSDAMASDSTGAQKWAL